MARNTRQRDAIRRVLQEAARPMSPQEILQAAGQLVPKLGMATVYRTLNLLVDEHEAVPVELPGEAARYELAGLGHHHHFRCSGCDRVYDVDCCGLDLSAVLPGGFTVERHEMLLVGRCATCNDAKPKSPPRRTGRRISGKPGPRRAPARHSNA